MGPSTSGWPESGSVAVSVIPQAYCTRVCPWDERPSRTLWRILPDRVGTSRGQVLVEERERPGPRVGGDLGVVLRRRGVVEEGVPDAVVDPRREVDARLLHARLELGHPVGDAVVVLAVEGEDGAPDRRRVGVLGEVTVEGRRRAQPRVGSREGEGVR